MLHGFPWALSQFECHNPGSDQKPVYWQDLSRAFLNLTPLGRGPAKLYVHIGSAKYTLSHLHLFQNSPVIGVLVAYERNATFI